MTCSSRYASASIPGRYENLALGETPNIAARLEVLAPPNTTVMSPSTMQLVQRTFVLEEFGLHPLKGIAEPMMLWRVVGPRETDSDVAGTTGAGFEVLVGRDEEIGLLLRRWQQSKEGLGQVVLIRGEAGIGKSSLVARLRNHVPQEGHTQIVLRCSPYHMNSAFYPIIEHVQRASGWQPDDTSETRLAKLEQELERTRLVLKEAVPLLASLLSMPLPEGRYPALTLSPQQQRQQTQDVLVAWLLEEAERHPVLAVWEDLHWADPSTLENLSLLVEQAPTAAMLHVLTFRPEFEPPWGVRSHLTPLALNRLERPQVQTLITRLAGGKLLPAEVIEHIVAKTDGVPLYVEELTKMLLASDLLREDMAHYELTGPLLSVAIPNTLQDSLMARLDQLGTAKEIAQLGAVVGREFTYDMARAIASMDESTLQERLEQIVAAELLYQRGRPPQATYMFKHALIRDAAYQSLLHSMRQEVHQRIVQVLETTFPERVAAQPAVLAHHCEGAGFYREAVAAWRQAGTQLRARSAYRESAASFERALEAHQQLPADRDMQTLAIDLRFDLRNAFFLLGDDERVLHHLREAATLAAALDDRERMGYAASFMAQHFNAVGDYDNAIAAGQRVLSLATARGEFSPQIGAHQHIGLAHYFLGNYPQAIASFRHNMSVLEGALAYEFFGRSFLPSVVSGGYLSQSLVALGDFDKGMAQAKECLRIADAVNHLSSQVFAGCAVGSVCLARGDLPRALASLERVHGLCQDADVLTLFLLTIAHLGYAYTLSGRVAEALPLLEQAVEQSAHSGAFNPTLWFAWLGETYLSAGHPNDALTLTTRALDLARAQKERGHEAWVLRHLGDGVLHSKPSELDQVETHYQQALALANELEMRPLQAHCRRGLGTLYRQIGQAEQARAELTAAIDMYRDMEMTFWLPQTEAAVVREE